MSSSKCHSETCHSETSSWYLTVVSVARSSYQYCYSPEWDASTLHATATPQHSIMPQQFTGIHLYILGGDGHCESKLPYTRYM